MWGRRLLYRNVCRATPPACQRPERRQTVWLSLVIVPLSFVFWLMILIMTCVATRHLFVSNFTFVPHVGSAMCDSMYCLSVCPIVVLSGYCWTLIGYCRQTIEWYQFRLPWLTSDPDFKVTVFLKWNRKLYAFCGMISLPVTSSVMCCWCVVPRW